ncbi:hemerythrin domain-containing protein [Desulfocurvibacter africanus]|uniref:hemerythrin domain-containing protein n=1 Tax=Desulfocurvibacter africanus TaxID=873 RepID=UPI00040CD907|nr:hemerythrin domain-containing protein [Desulfocurvibacter africanus]
MRRIAVLVIAIALLMSGAAWAQQSGQKSGQDGQQFLQALKQDHEKVMQDFKQLEQPGLSKEKKEQLWSQLKKDLEPHMKAEEETLYKTMEDKQSVKQAALRAEAEHQAAQTVMEKLDGMDVTDPRWDANLYVLSEQIKHHAKEEEGKFMQKAQQALGPNEMQKVYSDFQQEKQEQAK